MHFNAFRCLWKKGGGCRRQLFLLSLLVAGKTSGKVVSGWGRAPTDEHSEGRGPLFLGDWSKRVTPWTWKLRMGVVAPWCKVGKISHRCAEIARRRVWVPLPSFDPHPGLVRLGAIPGALLLVPHSHSRDFLSGGRGFDDLDRARVRSKTQARGRGHNASSGARVLASTFPNFRVWNFLHWGRGFVGLGFVKFCKSKEARWVGPGFGFVRERQPAISAVPGFPIWIFLFPEDYVEFDFGQI